MPEKDQGIKCGNQCSEKCIPFYDHQDTMMHYNWVNRRSMIQLIAVCLTMIIVVFIFATNQTKREEMWQESQKTRDQMWQETIKEIVSQTTAAEVDNGQQTNNP